MGGVMSTLAIPVETSDPINARILAVSEDKIQGFERDPLGAIARGCGVELPLVIERIAAMLRAGTIRRVRQTLMATNLARGALVAWQVPESSLQAAFEYMFHHDPFSGHVVIRSTDAVVAGSKFRLWTTVKVPQGYSMEKHCAFLASQTGATHFRLMPAKRLFALGVGHVRRRGMEPGSKSDELAEVLRHEHRRAERLGMARARRAQARVRADDIHETSGDRARKPRAFTRRASTRRDEPQRAKVIGRFSTFLEHVKTLKTGEQVTKYNALFHWAVPEGREIETGRQVGRFHIMTHATGARAAPTSTTSTSWASPTARRRTSCSPQGRDRRAPQIDRHRRQLHQRLLGRP
jgi:hypothetical protein